MTEVEGHHLKALVVTNRIEEAIVANNKKFAEDYDHIHGRIDYWGVDITNLREEVKTLKSQLVEWEEENHQLQDWVLLLESTVGEFATSLARIEGSICRCRDHWLLPCPHVTPDPADEMEVEETEEEEETGLEYATDDGVVSLSSYVTPVPTPGTSPIPSREPTPSESESNPSCNAHLWTREIDVRIEAFLSEVEDDLELGSNPPPLESLSPSPIPVREPLRPMAGFVPFNVSPTTQGQWCVPSCGLPTHCTFHPYANSVVG